ncbi:MAG: hypothetical protein IJT07_00495 [Oscillospiraceae bacterium]|nr:hypothetical protein [Oscillospiraceae bacterium]
MTAVDEIKSKLEKLYRTNPNIHISVSLSRPKIALENQAAVIRGIYRNIFQIEAAGKCYTLQYTDMLTQNFRIAELE